LRGINDDPDAITGTPPPWRSTRTTELDNWMLVSPPMTATQPRAPSGASAPLPIQGPGSGRVPVATTLVVFAIVVGLLAYIAIVG
jgi:hypothetical protein